jgi:hypothetical protein
MSGLVRSRELFMLTALCWLEFIEPMEDVANIFVIVP